MEGYDPMVKKDTSLGFQEVLEAYIKEGDFSCKGFKECFLLRVTKQGKSKILWKIKIFPLPNTVIKS